MLGIIKRLLVFTFWFKSGGIPNLLVEKSSNKNNNRLRLVQLNNGRQSQQLLNGIQHWAKMPLWPLPIDIQNVSLPFKFMLSQDHLYKVNYDLKSWERIVYELGDTSTLNVLNAKSRAQLLGDFYNDEKPSESNQLLIERLQRNFLEL
uniref:Uncharacterized protein n=1 Tax=Meloidogyne floridensis TaxID=298350 RepID=A0A915NSG3_9BILA